MQHIITFKSTYILIITLFFACSTKQNKKEESLVYNNTQVETINDSISNQNGNPSIESRLFRCIDSLGFHSDTSLNRLAKYAYQDLRTTHHSFDGNRYFYLIDPKVHSFSKDLSQKEMSMIAEIKSYYFRRKQDLVTSGPDFVLEIIRFKDSSIFSKTLIDSKLDYLYPFNCKYVLINTNLYVTHVRSNTNTQFVKVVYAELNKYRK